jgi:hypothetical protein
MKKLLVLMAMFIMVKANAQKVQLGFTGGLTIANYNASTNNIDESSDPKAGFAAGALVRIAVLKHFIIQPEINFVQKGTVDKSNAGGSIDKITLTTGHIEIPVNIMYASSKGFFVGGGPAVSLAVSGRLKAESGGTKVSEKVHFGSGDNDIMKGFDFGGNIVGGYKFKNGLLVSINYNLGFSNLISNNNTGTETLTSSYFGIKIGYLLNFAKKK